VKEAKRGVQANSYLLNDCVCGFPDLEGEIRGTRRLGEFASLRPVRPRETSIDMRHVAGYSSA